MDQSRISGEPVTEPDSGYFSPDLRGGLEKITKFDFDSDYGIIKNDDYAAPNCDVSGKRNFCRLSISVTDLHLEQSTVYRRRHHQKSALVRSCSDPCSIVVSSMQLNDKKPVRRPIAVVQPTPQEKIFYTQKDDDYRHYRRFSMIGADEESIHRLLAGNLRSIADRLDEKYLFLHSSSSSTRNPVPFLTIDRRRRRLREVKRLKIFQRVTNFCGDWYRRMKYRMVRFFNNVFH